MNRWKSLRNLILFTTVLAVPAMLPMGAAATSPTPTQLEIRSLCHAAGTAGVGATVQGRTVVAGNGDDGDQIVLNGANGRLSGGSGNDVLCASGGGKTLHGGSGDDILIILDGSGGNLLFGGSGDDVLLALRGDILLGGIGTNTVKAGNPNCAAVWSNHFWGDPSPIQSQPRNHTDADLSGCDLAGIALPYAFDGRYDDEADFSHANLSGADLSGANLLGARLRFADLSGTVFTNATLKRADLTGVTTTGDPADFRGANLEYAYLDSGHFGGSDFTNAGLQRAYLPRSDLRGANFTGANLAGALSNAATRLEGVVWDGATCPDGRPADGGPTRSCETQLLDLD